MRWKSGSEGREREPVEVDARERTRAELEARGVHAAAAEALAEHVGDEAVPSDAVLDGIALGFRAQNTVEEALGKSAADLQEIERLMGSFASELSKLDEVLEVLAAHLRRMRTTAPGSTSRTVH